MGLSVVTRNNCIMVIRVQSLYTILVRFAGVGHNGTSVTIGLAEVTLLVPCSPMNTNTLALHVAKRYLDHTLSLIKSTRDAIADVSGFEPHVGDLTVSEHNITAAVSNLDTFRISLKDPEKVGYMDLASDLLV